MAFVLIPGAGGAAWYWHLVHDELAARGHDVVSAELPAGTANDLSEYADAVVDAAGTRDGIVLVAQSMGGFTAAVAAPRLPVTAIVFLNAMIPLPGETPGAWGEAVGQSAAMRANDIAAGREPGSPFDVDTYFLHDVPDDLKAEVAQHGGSETEALFASACDFASWPDVPMHVIAGRDDRLLPIALQRRIAHDRLHLQADEVVGGHLAALSHPVEVTTMLIDGGRA